MGNTPILSEFNRACAPSSRKTQSLEDSEPVEWLTQVDSLSFYDAVLTIDRFQDVYDRNRGWNVRCRRDFDLANNLNGVRVTVWGHCNCGKTWMLSRLCGSRLPFGRQVHTEGLSIKAAQTAGFNVVLLDTVGSNSPIGSDALLRTGSAVLSNAEVQTMLEELHVQEHFYRQLSFQVAQVVLLVLGPESRMEQADLVQFLAAVRRGKERKDVIVVHNLREWSHVQLLQQANGLNYVEMNRILFDLRDHSYEVNVGCRTERIIRQKSILAVESAGASSPVEVTHYYLTDAGVDFALNEHTIQDIRKVITNVALRKQPLSQELAEAANHLQRHFVSFAGEPPPPRIVFESQGTGGATDTGLETGTVTGTVTANGGSSGSRGRFVAAGEAPVGDVALKPPPGRPYFAVGLEETPYNVTSAPCTVDAGDDEDTDRADQADGADRAERLRAQLLQVELPGLCTDSLVAIKRAIMVDKTALHWESPDGSGPRGLVVSFEACLLNVPEGLGDSIAQYYQGTGTKKGPKASVSINPGAHQPSEEGSWRTFTHGQRTVKVVIRTNIDNYDARWKPFVSYFSGILCVTFIDDPS